MSAQTTLPEVAPATPQPDRPKKKLLRRLEPDRSQPLRRAFQLAFLILNVILGVQFYLWVQAAMRRPFPEWAVAVGIAMLFLGTVVLAKATGHWDSHVPRQIYLELVPHADQATHPMPGR